MSESGLLTTEKWPLFELMDQAVRLPRDAPHWLLDASQLSAAIGQSVLGDPAQLEAVRLAVRQTADQSGCDLIVGASTVADQIVRALGPEVAMPTRALLFELVRITGASLAQALSELHHVDVVPAVLVDMHIAAEASVVTPVSVLVDEVSRR